MELRTLIDHLTIKTQFATEGASNLVRVFAIEGFGAFQRALLAAASTGYASEIEKVVGDLRPVQTLCLLYNSFGGLDRLIRGADEPALREYRTSLKHL